MQIDYAENWDIKSSPNITRTVRLSFNFAFDSIAPDQIPKESAEQEHKRIYGTPYPTPEQANALQRVQRKN
jgi:hypothetical protein